MRRRFMSSSKVAFDYSNYMTIEALDDEVKITYTKDIEYGVNGIGWNKYIKGFDIIIKKGQLISFKNNLTPGFSNGEFAIVGKCNLRGNCLSMIFGDNAKDNKDISLYKNSLIGLFDGCTGIQSVDENFLPATKLAPFCYKNMFDGCSSLVNAPELPATTLAEGCYNEMFYYCSKLNYIKMLALKLYAFSTSYWVRGVASSGTFVKNAAATWNVTGDDGVPIGWTIKTE